MKKHIIFVVGLACATPLHSMEQFPTIFTKEELKVLRTKRIQGIATEEELEVLKAIRAERKKGTLLTKEEQFDFRKHLARYRGGYVLQQLLNKTDGTEVEAETYVREDEEKYLEQLFPVKDIYFTRAEQRLEKFKNKEVPARFEMIGLIKEEAIVTELLQLKEEEIIPRLLKFQEELQKKKESLKKVL